MQFNESVDIQLKVDPLGGWMKVYHLDRRVLSLVKGSKLPFTPHQIQIGESFEISFLAFSYVISENSPDPNGRFKWLSSIDDRSAYPI